MKRINGHRDLEEYFQRLIKRKKVDLDILEEKKLITPFSRGGSALFWFKYFDVKVLFKVFHNEYSKYSELISEELANYLGFKNAQYDLATFQEKSGVITYDFKENNYIYINMEDVIRPYVISNPIYEKDLSYIQYDITNNLEDLWNALEYYFYHESDCPSYLVPDIIAKLMEELTDYFNFQIISGNFDMHKGNITVGITKDYSCVKLMPLYDNEDMFKLAGDIIYTFYDTPRLSVEREDLTEVRDIYQVYQKYLNISDEYFYYRSKKLFDKLNENTIYELFFRVEEKIESEIPKKIKEKVALNFNANLSKLKQILEKYEINQKKRKL